MGAVAVLRDVPRGRPPVRLPLVQRGRQADPPRGASGSRVFAVGATSGWGRSPLHSGPKERATVLVGVTGRNRRGARGSHARRGGRQIDLDPLTVRGMLLWRQPDAEDWPGFVEEVQGQHPVWG